jgi:small-conductance mechanosensitive channel
MRPAFRIPLLSLVTLALFVPSGFAQTSAPAPQHSAKTKKAKAQELPRAPVSDLINRILTEEARLDMAHRLSALASTPDEKQLAQKAVRLADHQLDLAFLVALRRAADNPPPPTPQLSELDATVKALQASVNDQQSVVDGLKKQLARASGKRKDTLQEQLELEQAKLELANDELTAAHEDLIDAGGDLKTQIERLQAEHTAAEQAAATTAVSNAAAPPAETPDTLLGHLKAWMALHSLRVQLEAAHDDAVAAVDTLRERLEATEKEVAGPAPGGPSTPQQPAPQAAAGAAAPGPSGLPAQSGSVTLEMLRRQSRNEKILAGYKLRIHDLTELAGTYSKWDALVAARQKETGRSLIFSGLWIALIVLTGIIANRLLQRLILRMTQERRRLHTLRTISRFGVQAFCLALILLVVLGPPSQLATVVAFAGAGLTVALKDFIVSFIGWFMLMGRNGVHAGDWVEINGVCGEVIEVTLFHTVVLETGNWSDPGHPTGRKVTFTNSYAIEGHYFNFTTSGQWLWDELEFLIPPGADPNAVSEAILQMVTSETQATAQLAEQEWSLMAGAKGAGPTGPSVSGTPVLTLLPTAFGITGRLRYITRANERFQARTRLYHLIVEYLHTHARQQGESAPVSPAARQA